MSDYQKHSDGGRFRVLKVGQYNEAGWAIILTEWTTYRGKVVHEVLRYSPNLNRTVRLEVVSSGEKRARERANTWWKFSRGTGAHPVHARVA